MQQKMYRRYICNTKYSMKTLSFLSVIILFVIVIDACSPKPYGATNKAYRQQAKDFTKIILQEPVDPVNDTIKAPPYWVGTTNYGLRKPNFVIIHHTAQHSCPETLTTFTTPKSAVSAHYVICKNGTVHHMLNDYFRAQHAGVSRWGNLIDINSSSIGIELDNTGFEYSNCKFYRSW
jgi:N-acetylmuramoyl-L-alanine amidase